MWYVICITRQQHWCVDWAWWDFGKLLGNGPVLTLWDYPTPCTISHIPGLPHLTPNHCNHHKHPHISPKHPPWGRGRGTTLPYRMKLPQPTHRPAPPTLSCTLHASMSLNSLDTTHTPVLPLDSSLMMFHISLWQHRLRSLSIFTNMVQKLGHKANLNTFKRIQIIQSVLPDHNWIILDHSSSI